MRRNHNLEYMVMHLSVIIEYADVLKRDSSNDPAV